MLDRRQGMLELVREAARHRLMCRASIGRSTSRTPSGETSPDTTCLLDIAHMDAGGGRAVKRAGARGRLSAGRPGVIRPAAMFRAFGALSMLAWLASCGAAGRGVGAVEADSDALQVPDCATLRAEAEAAERNLETCRSRAPASFWPHRAHFDWLAERINVRLTAMRRGEEIATTQIEAQEIAERVWTLLDAISEEAAPRALLDRAEEAAEGLVQQHTSDARERALASLASALATLRASIEPAPASPTCELEERTAAVAWVNAQAACTQLSDSFE